MTTTTVKERPILFSGPMVRAILDGRKTQTRRAIDRMAGFQVKHFDRSNTPGYDWHFRCQRGMWQDMDHAEVLSRCPYGQSGDRLWVRETCWSNGADVYYPADAGHKAFGASDEFYDRLIKLHHYAGGFSQKVPSIHMPRWASRITLEITGVRVERLQDISEADAMAEGIHKFHNMEMYGYDPKGTPGPMIGGSAAEAFYHLWESINGPDSWAANPYVWVIEFKRCEQ